MMDCGKARRLLWPTGGPRELTPALEAARQHLATCPACQAFEADMRHLAAQIGDQAPRETAPLEVRERLFGALAGARAAAKPGGFRSRRRALVAAAVVLVLIGLATADWRAHRAGPPDTLAALADDHMRAIGGDGVTSADTAVVAEWLRARLAFAVHVPVMPDLQLRGARLCLMDGRRGAVVEYRTAAGEPVSYYVVPAPEERAATVGFDVQRASRAGYHVVGWTEPGLLHALVANLPESRLVELARLCMKMEVAMLHPDLEAGHLRGGNLQPTTP
ncbi:MAG: hypothetical protein ACJ8DC_13135 [Gemmatimonadales bacterium]